MIINHSFIYIYSIKYKVTVVPTFICLQGKKVISRVEGVNPPELNKAVSNLLELPKTIESSSSNLNPKLEDSSTINNSLSKAVEERLIRLLSASPSLLFMKGTPDAPRCGFSRKIVELLRANEILFASFDILTDEEVRQGLKIYSDWPTYPQFYLNGDLIGGLDVLNEMAASGNLKSQLNLDEIPIISPVQPLDVRLKTLVSSSPTMIFIKGTPEEPRCGFSKSLVSILNSENIQFSYFDILTDEEVRQGLKVFSDWPTYPQIYSNGNLIGGLDIIKEMQSSGPLLSQLTQST